MKGATWFLHVCLMSECVPLMSANVISVSRSIDECTSKERVYHQEGVVCIYDVSITRRVLCAFL